MSNLFALAWLAIGAHAQEPEPEDAEVEALLNLPQKAQALRQLGVDPNGVRSALEAAEANGLTGREAEEMLDGGRNAVDEHGPVDNFGAFVQARLDEGLRGRALAEAIRAEHQARGIGKGRKAKARAKAKIKAADGDLSPKAKAKMKMKMRKAKAKAKAQGGGE